MTRIDDRPPETIQRAASARAGLAAIVVGLLIAVGMGSVRVGPLQERHERTAPPAPPAEVIVVTPPAVADGPAHEGDAADAAEAPPAAP